MKGIVSCLKFHMGGEGGANRVEFGQHICTAEERPVHSESGIVLEQLNRLGEAFSNIGQLQEQPGQAL